MVEINELLHELGISKVRLAKYLGVSRQMVYNYLENDDINKWPKEKRIKFFELVGIKSSGELKKIKVDSDYIMTVESRLNKGVQSAANENNDDIKKFNKKEQELLVDINSVLKEIISEGNAVVFLKYMYNTLQSGLTSKEVKYTFSYFSKAFGFTNPSEFEFDDEGQLMFEGIMFTALSMYKGGGLSKSKVEDAHKRFVAELEQKKDEKLSRTQELNTAKVQALRELNYEKITNENASEVFNKIAEIQSRTV